MLRYDPVSPRLVVSGCRIAIVAVLALAPGCGDDGGGGERPDDGGPPGGGCAEVLPLRLSGAEDVICIVDLDSCELAAPEDAATCVHGLHLHAAGAANVRPRGWSFVGSSGSFPGEPPPARFLGRWERDGEPQWFVLRTDVRHRYRVGVRLDSQGMTVETVEGLPTLQDCPGAERGVRCTRHGDPRWTASDVHLFAAEQGSVEVVMNVLTRHAYYVDRYGNRVIGSDPAQPHGPPYQGEIAAGLAAAGYEASNVFPRRAFAPPRAVHVLYLIAPTERAPHGRTADFADGPYWPESWEPLWIDGDLLHEGVSVDSEWDLYFPAFENFRSEIGGDGYSHMFGSWYTNSDYFPAAVGEYELQFHLIDGTFNGWDLLIPFSITE